MDKATIMMFKGIILLLPCSM